MDHVTSPTLLTPFDIDAIAMITGWESRGHEKNSTAPVLSEYSAPIILNSL